MTSHKKIRVLVVDDSAFMRKVISDILNSDPEIEVIGTAKDGVEAVELVQKLQPDVVTMDVEMPRMNGLEAVRKIMEIRPTPIVMLSALTKEGSKITFEALEAGAVDFISKPSGSISLDIRKIGEDIIKKVKHAAKAKVVKKIPTIAKPKPATEDRVETAVSQISSATEELMAPDSKLKEMCVIIGSSTGGPPVVTEIISKLPKRMPPIFVVQHMPPGFTKLFADRINQVSKLNVKEAEHGERVMPGYVYIAPGDYHMLLTKRGDNVYISLDNKMPKVNGTRPAVDITAEAVANIYGGKSVGVILTGIGKDGAYGFKKIKEKGGKIIAQDGKTCVVFGMPKAVIELGIADLVLPPSEIPRAIVKFCKEILGG
ncbi:response regulator receiver modulated CheB methylesterase [Methanocaldococcus bathoardescens]|uniref:Protein-glutamate methylesterase/protein-glutamine glutaminase n=1 Tax=Methanocaldococcus bathoardescens TaxID=1301915 RepID=A0A076LFX4_9EURY|nr:chemotaxis response regulator protein-glutamate methylesterase [Methanocaldococcus bathoardescens]AIJ05777.1 response regulator receiver modulated CheB methylesterase [Methanocaldococcus bathoardescens]